MMAIIIIYIYPVKIHTCVIIQQSSTAVINGQVVLYNVVMATIAGTWKSTLISIVCSSHD